MIVYNILLFYDDFENYNANDYHSAYWFTIWSGVSDSTFVDTNFSYEGKKSFRLCGSSDWVRTDGVKLNLTNLSKITYECAVLIPSGSSTGTLAGFFVKLNPSLGTIYNGILFDYNDSLVYVRGVDPQATGYKWQYGTWYNVKVGLNYDSLLMDVWINEQKIAENIPAQTKEISDTFALATEYGAGGAVYFDKIQVFKK